MILLVPNGDFFRLNSCCKKNGGENAVERFVYSSRISAHLSLRDSVHQLCNARTRPSATFRPPGIDKHLG